MIEKPDRYDWRYESDTNGSKFNYLRKELKELESENAPLSIMYMARRSFNSLHNNNVTTIKDLISKSEKELLNIKGLGPVAISEIEDELEVINELIETDYKIGKHKKTKQTNRKDPMTIDYKFNEGQIIQDIKEYVDKTYTSHYAQDVTKQATETIIDQGHGTGFCMGNILKYAQRYGKKEGKNKNDLLKVIHYAIIQLSQDHH